MYTVPGIFLSYRFGIAKLEFPMWNKQIRTIVATDILFIYRLNTLHTQAPSGGGTWWYERTTNTPATLAR